MELQKSTLEPVQKLSAPQKKFQKLCQKIEQEQLRLNEWQTAQADIQARASREILPTYAQLREVIFQQIQQLLQQKQQKVTAAQQTKLDQKIEQLSLQLLDSQQMSTEQVQFLTELLNSYGHHIELLDTDDVDLRSEAKTATESEDENLEQCEQNSFEHDEFEQERLAQLKLESLKHFLCEEYDLDLEFFDFQHDPLDLDDFIKKFEQKMQEQEELDFLSQLSSAQKAFAEQQIAREKAKVAKKQQQREEAKKLANQSIKAIYLKITAWIHPDREQDEQIKQEKTVLM